MANRNIKTAPAKHQIAITDGKANSIRPFHRSCFTNSDVLRIHFAKMIFHPLMIAKGITAITWRENGFALHNQIPANCVTNAVAAWQYYQPRRRVIAWEMITHNHHTITAVPLAFKTALNNSENSKFKYLDLDLRALFVPSNLVLFRSDAIGNLPVKREEKMTYISIHATTVYCRATWQTIETTHNSCWPHYTVWKKHR